MTVSGLHLGLPRPVTSQEVLEDPSIADMRRAIMCGVCDSRLIRECLEVWLRPADLQKTRYTCG
jgi:hypothetical protein